MQTRKPSHRHQKNVEKVEFLLVHEEVPDVLVQASIGLYPLKENHKNELDQSHFDSILPLDICYTVLYLLWHHFERHELPWH